MSLSWNRQYEKTAMELFLFMSTNCPPPISFLPLFIQFLAEGPHGYHQLPKCFLSKPTINQILFPL